MSIKLQPKDLTLRLSSESDAFNLARELGDLCRSVGSDMFGRMRFTVVMGNVADFEAAKKIAIKIGMLKPLNR